MQCICFLLKKQQSQDRIAWECMCACTRGRQSPHGSVGSFVRMYFFPFAYLKGTPAWTFWTVSDKEIHIRGCFLLKWDGSGECLFLYQFRERERERESNGVGVIAACLFKNISLTTQTWVYLSNAQPLITFSKMSSWDPKHWVILS